jgi:tight adherence protein B
MTLAFIGIHLRSQVIRTIVERREATLRGQVLKFTNGLDAYTRSGMGLAEAIESTARETDAPLGVFVNRISRDARRGRPLVEALNAVRSSMRLEPFSLLATAITCSLREGSSLSASLAGVQQSLEDRMNVERLMYSKTSSTRRSMLILGLSPIGFLVLFSFSMSSQMTMLLTQNLGRAFLAAIILLMYTGIAWMQRILVVRD